MCMVLVLGRTLTRRNRGAKARFLAQHPNGVSETDLSREVQRLLRDGQRIRALKQFRKDTGLGLRDAKEIIDAVTV